MTLYQQAIHIMKYARWRDNDNRRETFEETVDRYLDYICDVQCKDKVDSETKLALRSAILNLDVMPSMRALMSAGPALARDSIASYNCSYLPVNDVAAFDEMMYLLMCAAGVGFSVERQEIAKLPEIPILRKSRTVIKVEDSRIGWANALRELTTMLYQGRVPEWDVSEVRPAGSKLKTFGGRASGPEPLVDLFKFIGNVFKQAQGRKLSSIECHDICCKIGEIVVAGGVRRSALLSLSNLSDDRMRGAKSGEWYNTTPWRRLANNSVAYTEKPEMAAFFKEWYSLYESKSGERGIFNRAAAKRNMSKDDRRDPNYDFGCNPCVVDSTNIETSLGVRTVSELIDTPFLADVGGKYYESSGFYYTGDKDVYRLSTDDPNIYLDATYDHDILTITEIGEEFVALGKLTTDDYVAINSDNTTPKAIRVKSIKHIGVKPVYDCSVAEVNRFSANGIIVHNCGEIFLRPNGLCNLSEVVIRADDDYATAEHKVKLATILGTLQATITDFRYLRKVWSDNAKEEALLGVSLTGVMDNELFSGKLGKKQLRETLAKLKLVAIDTNIEWADKLGINKAAAVTCQKPSGCRPSYALTTTDKGILTLDELLVSHDPAKEWSEHSNTSAILDNTNSKVTQTYINGDANVTRLMLAQGLELDSTNNHRWWVIKNGKTEINDWKYTRDIIPGDVLDVNIGVYDNTNTTDFTAGLGVDKSNPVTVDLAWLLGLIFPEFTKSVWSEPIVIQNDNSSVINKAKLVLDKCNIDYVCSDSGITVSSDIFRLWLADFNQYAYHIKCEPDSIPKIIRQSSYSDIISFIAGVFDCKGKILDDHVSMELNNTGDRSRLFSSNLQHVSWSVGLAISRSEFESGIIFDINTQATDIARDIFIKSSARLSNCNSLDSIIANWRSNYDLGVVVSRDSLGEMRTYDIETNDHWYYAGSVKSHNTVSQLVDAASGGHPRWSKYYIRTIRCLNDDPVGRLLKDSGVPCEPDVMSKHNTTVFSFPIKSPDNCTTRDEVSALDQLELWKIYKDEWCDHNPSVTIYVREHQWMEVGAWVYKNFDSIGGLSFLPYYDHVYAQAPYQEITEDEYNELNSNMPKSIDWLKLSEYEDDDSNVTAQHEMACLGGSCEIVDNV